MSAISNIKLAVRKLGIAGTIGLLLQKRTKAKRLASDLFAGNSAADLKQVPVSAELNLSEEEKLTIVTEAGEMLADGNIFFSFRYHLRGVDDPWSYDPLEKKYWPKRQYEETRVHGADTPRDVKIVWEINRFKDLPVLAQAAYITKEKKYADELEWRMLSWIDGNVFHQSVNWSSPLEIAIRLISWASSLRLLAAAGFHELDPKIYSSIWQQAVYLNAALSTDKIVRSNHLIGETTGLYVVSSLFDFPHANEFRTRAKEILTDSIFKQTYPDGASRESSGWYHAFVTTFGELALRAAGSIGDSFSTEFQERVRAMMIYRNSIIATDGSVVKYGDFDNGKAIELGSKWRDICLGKMPIATNERFDHFDNAKHITAQIDKSHLFIRAGEFGWGGAGFSSHAHDDFLAPSVCLNSLPILVDPGTFVYNGDPAERDKYRAANYHNGLIIGDSTGAAVKPNFGWIAVRPDAEILSYERANDKVVAEASYGEWKARHTRRFVLSKDEFEMEDKFKFNLEQPVEWNFHFHPRWRLEGISATKFLLKDFRDNRYEFELSGVSGQLELLPYDFSPSYMEKDHSEKLRLRSRLLQGAVTVRIAKQSRK